MKARVKWVEGKTFLGESQSGHAVVMSAPMSPGAAINAPSPMEYLLLGTGGCMSVDVMMILQKGRHDIRDCELELDSERPSEDPKIFTKIHMHFRITGKGLKPDAVQRAIDLAGEKYCSASIMLGKTAQITHDFEIIEAA